jgi:hypothetical protein
MKKTVSIEIEETITETRIVVPGDIHCPACGSVVSLRRTESDNFEFSSPRIETIVIKPEEVRHLDPTEEE